MGATVEFLADEVHEEAARRDAELLGRTVERVVALVERLGCCAKALSERGRRLRQEPR